jgi:hypothetical protein
MDEFLSQFFSEPDYVANVPLRQRPEIQDAIARVLLSRGILTRYRVELSEPYSAGYMNVERVRITIRVKTKVNIFLVPVEVWVDDFELAFTFIKETC